jgi:hypothetical protein
MSRIVIVILIYHRHNPIGHKFMPNHNAQVLTMGRTKKGKYPLSGSRIRWIGNEIKNPDIQTCP